MATLILRSDIQKAIPSLAPFDHIMSLTGETVRAKDGRHTFKIVLGGRPYFIKQHNGVGWREILKELITLKWPIVSARNEYEAIEYSQKVGILTMTVAGFGKRGLNPAGIQSFIVTDEITDTLTLKEITNQWLNQPAGFRVKHSLLLEIATIARRMHGAGMNHRDFYLCHFRMKAGQVKTLDRESPGLYLMDLHRVEIRQSVPRRWLVKDIGALYFSAAHLPLTRRDLLRFMRYYSGKPLRQTLSEDGQFWRLVMRRAQKFYRREWGREMPLLLPTNA